jgi:hypothetical protein
MLGLVSQLASRLRLRHVLALFAALLALLFMPLGVQTRTSEALADMAHAPAFGIVAVLIAGWATRHWAVGSAADRRWSPEAVCLAVWLGVTLLGGATEIVQGWVGRGKSLHDAVSNSLGAAAFLAAYLAINSATTGSRARYALLGVVGLAAAWSVPLVSLADVWRQYLEVPMLADFERASELDRWTPHHVGMVRTRRHATHGQWSAALEFEPHDFSGVTLRVADLDWSGYDTLEFDLYVPEPLAKPVYLKLVDRPYNGKQDDRFDVQLALEPGHNHVRVPLADVVSAPRGRPFDLSRLWWLEFYVLEGREPQQIFLDNMRLSAGG